MRYRLGLCLAATVLLAGAKAPELPVPSKAAISRYAKDKDGSTKDEPLAGWERALKNALLKQAPDQAADQLAANFSLTAPQMRELVRRNLPPEAGGRQMGVRCCQQLDNVKAGARRRPYPHVMSLPRSGNGILPSPG
jgi:hypothetical protein